VSELAAVAAMWRHREKVEHEAAALFARLGAALDTVGDGALASRCRAAAEDELRHAARCRAIIASCAPGLPPLPPAPAVLLGPPDLTPAARTLYTSVAMGCVTETLSCALLLAMRDVVTYAPVKDAVEAIVRDEIEHGRIGWAHLTIAAGRGDVAWLGPYVAAMRDAALRHDVAPTPVADDLAMYGILSRAAVDTIVAETWRDVIVPGLARAGVAV
jgi:hypothetical protein